MKMLSIIRHAKSSWDYPDLSDFDRPIRNKGIKRTRKVCGFLTDHDLLPELILTSKAARALETAKLICSYLALSEDIIKGIEEFYPGTIQSFIGEIQSLDKSLQHVMVVGHNPCITNLLNHLVVNKVIDWLPTSGLSVLSSESSTWKKIQAKTWELHHYVVPKQILNNN